LNKKIRQQLLLRGLVIAPIIALLVCSPIYLVKTDPQIKFLQLWFSMTLATLIIWGLQVFIFTFCKKRGFANWQYLLFFMMFILAIVFGTTPFLSKSSDFFKSTSLNSVIALRFSLLTAISLMIYLIIDLVYTQETRVQLIEENALLKFSNLESEYKLLKAQVNPHFLFNALNISKSLIKTQPQNAEKYILQLSEFLRRSINNQQKLITLEKELENCQQYIDLQKVRFESAFRYTVDVNRMHNRKKLPFYALITLVENAFKHNSFSEEAPLQISISMTEDDYVVVKNNLKTKNGVVSTHTGLSNLNQRSVMLSDAEIEIDNDGQQFSVKVKLIES